MKLSFLLFFTVILSAQAATPISCFNFKQEDPFKAMDHEIDEPVFPISEVREKIDPTNSEIKIAKKSISKNGKLYQDVETFNYINKNGYFVESYQIEKKKHYTVMDKKSQCAGVFEEDSSGGLKLVFNFQFDPNKAKTYGQSVSNYKDFFLEGKSNEYVASPASNDPSDKNSWENSDCTWVRVHTANIKTCSAGNKYICTGEVICTNPKSERFIGSKMNSYALTCSVNDPKDCGKDNMIPSCANDETIDVGNDAEKKLWKDLKIKAVKSI